MNTIYTMHISHKDGSEEDYKLSQHMVEVLHWSFEQTLNEEIGDWSSATIIIVRQPETSP